MSSVAVYKKFVNEDIEIPSGEYQKKFVKGQKKLMKIFMSPKLETLLKKMLMTADFKAKQVARRILNIDNEEENLFDISYLDLDKDKDDSISYMPANRAWYKLAFANQEEADKTPAPNCEMWTGSGRQSMTVGKLINKLFEDTFHDVAIDSFVKAFKAEVAATMIYNNFKLVKGEEIRKWYAETNYYKDPSHASSNGGGTLNGSCMRYEGGGKNCQKFFDIYVDNPDKCGMLILTNNQNKLLGRAIVWFDLKKPTGGVFMDRIYTVKQSDEELFKKYAQEQGWLYKYNQGPSDYSYMEKGQRVNKSVAVQLKGKKFSAYPYMDTLKYYNPTTGRLGSDPGNPVADTKRLKLESTGGSSSSID